MGFNSLSGKPTLAYGGVTASTPPQFVKYNRRPTPNDWQNFEIGTLWEVDNAALPYEIWQLVSLSQLNIMGRALWIRIFPQGGVGAGEYICNEGGSAVPVDGQLNVYGGANIYTVASDPGPGQININLNDDVVLPPDGSLTLEFVGSGVMQTDADGHVTSNRGTNGQLLIASSLGAPIWHTLTAGPNITITNGNNSIQISATGGGGGGGATTFFADDNTMGPAIVAAGDINIYGDSNITTISSNPAGLGQIQVTLDNNVAVSGSITAGNGLVASDGGLTVQAGTVTFAPFAAGAVVTNNAGIAFSENGNATYVLTSNGPGVPPTFQASSGGGGGSGTDCAFFYYQGDTLITMPTNAFSKYRIGVGGPDSILNQKYDDDNNFYPGDGVSTPASFTAPITGKYYIEFYVTFQTSVFSGSAAFSPLILSIVQAGSASNIFQYFYQPNSAAVQGTFYPFLYSTVIDLVANDVLTFTIQVGASSISPVRLIGQTGGTYMAQSNYATYVAGFLINTGGSGGTNTFHTNAGDALSAGGAITINGDGVNTTTSGSGSTVVVHLDNNVSLPDTNMAGTAGILLLGGDNFLHNYGTQNVFLGEQAGNLTLNAVTADQNVGIGEGALNALTTGSDNTMVGYFAGNATTTSISATGVGSFALGSVTTGTHNTAYGSGSLSYLVSGDANIAVGFLAGSNYTTDESSNILIGNRGTILESNTIRIGTEGSGTGQQDTTYCSGIYTNTVGATNGLVAIDNTGKLGLKTLTSTGGSVTITQPTVGTINLEAAGVAALTALAGDSGSASPSAGSITIAGSTNITTAAASHTVTITLDNSPSVSGSLTAATNITATGGDITATAGNIYATAGNIVATAGNVTALAGTLEGQHATITSFGYGAVVSSNVGALSSTNGAVGYVLTAQGAGASPIFLPAPGGGGGVTTFHTDGTDAIVAGGAITIAGDGIATQTAGAVSTVTVSLRTNPKITGVLDLNGIAAGFTDSDWLTGQIGGQTVGSTPLVLFNIPVAAEEACFIKAYILGYKSTFDQAVRAEYNYGAYRPTGGDVTAIGALTGTSDVGTTIGTGVLGIEIVTYVAGESVQVIVSGPPGETWNWIATISFMFLHTNA